MSRMLMMRMMMGLCDMMLLVMVMVATVVGNDGAARADDTVDRSGRAY